jgi:hypothetical protein
MHHREPPLKSHTPPRRRTRHIRLRADAALETERLDSLASAIEAVLARDVDHPPTLVVAIDDGDEVEVRLRALDHHPSLELEGLVAPPSWWCLGVVSGGFARPYDLGTEPVGATPRDRYRVHLAHLVARTGLSARVLRDQRTGEVVVQDTTSYRDHAVGAADPIGREHAGGQLDDYLRCALGLPTPPPHRGTVELFAALWIHRVMNEAAMHRLLDASWPHIAGQHPVLDVPRAVGDDQLQQFALADLVRAGALMAEAHPWDRVRATCQLGIGPVSGPPADLAGWLDTGAFSRLVMAMFGPIEDLLVDLHELVRPEVHAQLIDTIGAWGLLDGS